MVSFNPLKKMKYIIKCPILTDNEGIDDYRFKINVYGEGKDGELKLEPENYEFDIMVNFVKTQKFVLYNNSDTTFNTFIEIEIDGNFTE